MNEWMREWINEWIEEYKYEHMHNKPSFRKVFGWKIKTMLSEHLGSLWVLDVQDS